MLRIIINSAVEEKNTPWAFAFCTWQDGVLVPDKSFIFARKRDIRLG